MSFKKPWFESLISHLDHSNDQKRSATEFSITGVGLQKTKEICNRDFVGMFPEKTNVYCFLCNGTMCCLKLAQLDNTSEKNSQTKFVSQPRPLMSIHKSRKTQPGQPLDGPNRVWNKDDIWGGFV